MRIASIRLVNFKKHKDTFVEFEDGSNMITGPNYAGKSTLLQGILVGLFGNSAAPGTTQELIRTGAQDFKVVIVTTSGLTVTRTSKNSSAARGQEEPFARGHTAVNAAISEELSLGKQAFMRIFASEQGTPQQLLAMEGSELQRFIESCTGIDQLDGIVKEANRRRAYHTTLMESLTGQIIPEDRLTEVQAQAGEASHRLEFNRKDLAEIGVNIHHYQEKANELHASLEGALQHNKKVEAYGFLASELGKLSHMEMTCTNALQEHIQKLAERTKTMETWQRLVGEVDAVRAQIFHLEPQANAVVPELVDTSELEGILEELVQPEMVDSTGLHVELTKLQSDVRAKATEIKSIRASLEDAICRTCKRPLDGAGVCREDAETAIADLTHDCECAEAKIQELDQAIVDITRTNKKREADFVNNRRVVQSELAAARRENERGQEERQKALSAQQRLGLLKEKLAELQAALDALPVIPDVAAHKAEETAVWNELEAVKRHNTLAEANNRLLAKKAEELQAFGPDPGEAVDTKELMESIQDVRKHIDAYNKEYRDTRDFISQQEVLLSGFRKQLDDHAEAHGKFKNHSQSAETYKSVSQILTSSRSRIVSEALSAIFAIASEFAKACTGGDIEEVLLHNDAISYKEGGVIYTKHSASGAQKTLMGIGMKLGLVKLTRTNFDCLLLDEVSADMDPEVSLRCALALGSFCGQSISVSHRPMDVSGNVISLA